MDRPAIIVAVDPLIHCLEVFPKESFISKTPHNNRRMKLIASYEILSPINVRMRPVRIIRRPFGGIGPCEKLTFAEWKRANDLEHVMLRVQNLLDPGVLCENGLGSASELVGLALGEGWIDVEDVVESKAVAVLVAPGEGTAAAAAH